MVPMIDNSPQIEGSKFDHSTSREPLSKRKKVPLRNNNDLIDSDLGAGSESLFLSQNQTRTLKSESRVASPLQKTGDVKTIINLHQPVQPTEFPTFDHQKPSPQPKRVLTKKQEFSSPSDLEAKLKNEGKIKELVQIPVNLRRSQFVNLKKHQYKNRLYNHNIKHTAKVNKN